MSRRPSTPATPQPAKLSLDDMKRAIPRLQKRLEAVQAFDPNVSSEEHARQTTRALRASIEEALTQTFGTESVEYRRYRGAANLSWPMNMVYDTPLHEIRDSLRSDKQESIDLLNAAIDALTERIAEASEIGSVDPVSEKIDFSKNRQVFVVHGHDEGARNAVARFLEKIELRPTILSEQPNKGRTIIEKFEAHAEVGFAVVLLTPDDEGCAKGSPPQPRARQNVILELGYFIGKLGRARVCALKSAGLEIPSDILGVVWTEYDPNGGWQRGLANELQAAGYEIDWNKVMRP